MRQHRRIALLAVSLVAARAAAMDYHLTDLGVLLGGVSTIAKDVNSDGEVVGYGDAGAFNHAFRYFGGSLIDMGTFGGRDSGAVAINSRGQIVGYYDGGAFLYSNGQMTQLGSLGGGSASTTAADINDDGTIVGDSFTASGSDHAFMDVSGAFTDLGTLAGGDLSRATGMNGLGDVVGFSASTDFPGGEAFLYSNGKMTGLGTLGGSQSVAYAINDSGMIVGSSLVAGSGEQRAFAYVGGTMVQINGPLSFATDVNNLGQVVGTSADGAFIYENGSTTNLGSLIDASGAGYTMIGANAISDNGYICGFAETPSGAYHAVLLSPVPEPASALAVGLGAVGLVARKRRK